MLASCRFALTDAVAVLTEPQTSRVKISLLVREKYKLNLFTSIYDMRDDQYLCEKIFSLSLYCMRRR